MKPTEILELAKECGATTWMNGCPLFEPHQLQAFAAALLKQECEGQEASNSLIDHYVFINGNYYKVEVPLFTRPPIQSQREIELCKLLQEGVDGFGRVLVATSDDKSVRDWQKRCKIALSVGGDRAS